MLVFHRFLERARDIKFESRRLGANSFGVIVGVTHWIVGVSSRMLALIDYRLHLLYTKTKSLYCSYFDQNPVIQ